VGDLTRTVVVARHRPPPPKSAARFRSLIALVLLTLHGSFQCSCTSVTAPDERVVVERVIDGDTIVLEGGVRVRLLGLDAPELGQHGGKSECYAPEAKVFLESLITGADRSIFLSFEPVRYDRYGRTLAYLWDGERFLNEVLLREGYARFHAGDSVRWRERLRLAAAQAQAARRGLWHPGACP